MVELIISRLIKNKEKKLQGIIIENISNLYRVKSENKVFECTARGKLKMESITPLVGDKVEIETIDDKNKEAVITNILPRTVELKRPKVANITQMILVISTKHPKPDLLMLDKQLAYLEYLNIKPIIVINKIDLSNSYKEIVETYSKVGYTIIPTNSKECEGIDKLKELLKNNMSAFSGNSGVGKSTTINALFNDDITLEGEISKKNKKGKNTTTAIKLYELDNNSFIADTPGFANFNIEELDYKKLENYFIDIKPHVANCEFVGCTHIKEENCGVKNAIKEGKLLQERYDRFCKIYNELKEKEERKW